MCNLETVAAIATPAGNGGVGIIRLSGANSYQIAKELVSRELRPRYAEFCTLKIGDITDTAIAIYFPAPNSFTGEDVVELQLHGGEKLLNIVLNEITSPNHTTPPTARLAQPGEFTRRALLNGKITLGGAENLINLIHAECDAEILANSSNTPAQITEKLLCIEHELVEISAQIEGAIDHPDEIEFNPKPIKNKIRQFVKTLAHFTDTAKTSHYIYSGINAAILGEPNAGKSSLFNALLGHDRSIVTEIAGTTTDAIAETIQIEGFRVRITDTAGIRTAENKIEKLGIERTLRAAAECDIAIIFDQTARKIIGDKPYILVNRSTDPDKIKHEIIAKTVGSMDKIRGKSVANARQLNELNSAQNALNSALETAEIDCMASDIQTALFHIANITGTNPTEAVLDEIFSRFCLGK
jgi:tRNA modification GTPase